ncbi:GNAT family N-acetyltransferase [Mollicutes bacterium LVI A0078]|nr:GNAT family N-acetyltransferase [Mollicutes bacterium LVI A0075]WOO90560.1 GNAT family N-acetyltransferase [Mollicutes bacterium LVI A0078]
MFFKRNEVKVEHKLIECLKGRNMELSEQIEYLENKLSAINDIPLFFKWYKELIHGEKEYVLYIWETETSLDFSLKEIETNSEVCSANLGIELMSLDYFNNDMRMYKKLHLGRLDTDEHHRSQGLGSLLLDEIKAYAKENNYWIIDYLSYQTSKVEDIRREKFYYKNGFRNYEWINPSGSLVTINMHTDESIKKLVEEINSK